MNNGFILMDRDGFLKRNWKNLLILILFLCLVLSTCTCRKIQKDCATIESVTSDTVRTHSVDTVYITIHDTTYSKPQVVRIHPPSAGKITPPSTKPDEYIKQYYDLADSFYSKKVYEDTQSIKDSTGKEIVNLTIIDSVTENKILDRKILSRITYPKITIHDTTTITTTITKKAPPKNQYFLGVEALGNAEDIISGAAINFLIQNKKNSMFSVSIGGVSYDSNLKAQFGIGYYKRL